MNKIKKYSRRYAYKMRHKYRRDPFAFIVLWVLFFSAIFLIFSFRGLIAVSFMKKVDIDQSKVITEEIIDGESIDNELSSSVDEVENKGRDIQFSGDTYTVQAGDSLYGIGLELGKDWQEIAYLNEIEPPYNLNVGQVLKLP